MVDRYARGSPTLPPARRMAIVRGSGSSPVMEGGSVPVGQDLLPSLAFVVKNVPLARVVHDAVLFSRPPWRGVQDIDLFALSLWQGFQDSLFAHPPERGGVQGCLFTLNPLRGVQGGGVAFAAARSTARSHTRFREGSGPPSRSLALFREESRGRLSTPCLHKGTSATESVRGSVCMTAVLSRGPVVTFTTTSKGTPAPSLPGDRGCQDRSAIRPNGTVPTRRRVRTGGAFFAMRQPAKPRRTGLYGRVSLLRC